MKEKIKHSVFVDYVMGIMFALMWGSAFTSARIIVQDAPPLTISSLRFLLAGFIAILIARILGQSWIFNRQQWLGVGIFGLCQNAIYLGLFFVAMQWIEASLAAILASTMPLLVALFNRIFFYEILKPLAIIGLISGFSGVTFIMIDKLSSNVDIRGIIACAIGIIALTLATLSVKKASSGGNILMVVGLQMLVGGIVLAISSFFLEPWVIIWTRTLTLAFIYTAVVPGLIATWVWFKLVARVGATRASRFHFLNPFFGVLIANSILDEALSISDYIGVVIIALGILAVQASKHQKSN